jgi:toxin-antitoxin system PIN domain toxin
MIVPDINLLLYAYDSESSFHAEAAGWWQECLSGAELVGLPQVVAFGFLRIGTNRRAFQNPMSSTEAAGHIRSWIEQPNVELLVPGKDHIEQVLSLVGTLGVAANLVTDAQIAALTIANDALLHTADSDFARFPGLCWFNPLTKVGSDSLRIRRSQTRKP